MKRMVYNTLNRLGVPCHIKGRTYIETALGLIAERGHLSVTKELYPIIAETHNATPKGVEKAIGHAIEWVFPNADIGVIEEIFGSAISFVSGKMTNAAFLYGVAKYIEISEEAK